MRILVLIATLILTLSLSFFASSPTFAQSFSDSEKKLQEITDQFVAKIEEMGEKKKTELLQI